jgi:starch phosphorylase
MTAAEVRQARESGYRPRAVYEQDADLREVIDQIAGGHFCGADRDLFKPLAESLLGQDEYMLLADYRSYVERQQAVSRAFGDAEEWTRSSIMNCARAGRFSSDRAVREYCRDIWHASPLRTAPGT